MSRKVLRRMKMRQAEREAKGEVDPKADKDDKDAKMEE